MTSVTFSLSGKRTAVFAIGDFVRFWNTREEQFCYGLVSGISKSRIVLFETFKGDPSTVMGADERGISALHIEVIDSHAVVEKLNELILERAAETRARATVGYPTSDHPVEHPEFL